MAGKHRSPASAHKGVDDGRSLCRHACPQFAVRARRQLSSVNTNRNERWSEHPVTTSESIVWRGNIVAVRSDGGLSRLTNHQCDAHEQSSELQRLLHL